MVIRYRSAKGTIWYERYRRPHGVVPNMSHEQFQAQCPLWLQKKVDRNARKYGAVFRVYVYDPAHGTYTPHPVGDMPAE